MIFSLKVFFFPAVIWQWEGSCILLLPSGGLELGGSLSPFWQRCQPGPIWPPLQLLRAHVSPICVCLPVLRRARCWVDRNHLSGFWLLSSVNVEKILEFCWNPGALAHSSIVSGMEGGKVWRKLYVGETRSPGVFQNGSGYEVRGPDSLVVKTLWTHAHAPYSSLIVVQIFKYDTFSVLLT